MAVYSIYEINFNERPMNAILSSWLISGTCSNINRFYEWFSQLDSPVQNLEQHNCDTSLNVVYNNIFSNSFYIVLIIFISFVINCQLDKYFIIIY